MVTLTRVLLCWSPIRRKMRWLPCFHICGRRQLTDLNWMQCVWRMCVCWTSSRADASARKQWRSVWTTFVKLMSKCSTVLHCVSRRRGMWRLASRRLGLRGRLSYDSCRPNWLVGSTTGWLYPTRSWIVISLLSLQCRRNLQQLFSHVQRQRLFCSVINRLLRDPRYLTLCVVLPSVVRHRRR